MKPTTLNPSKVLEERVHTSHVGCSSTGAHPLFSPLNIPFWREQDKTSYRNAFRVIVSVSQEC